MQERLFDGLFFLIVLSVPLCSVVPLLQVHFLGGPIGWQLTWYPLVAGILCTLYCQYRYRNVLCGWKPFRNYMGVFFLVLLAGVWLGLQYPPIQEAVMGEPMAEQSRMARVLEVLSGLGIPAEREAIQPLWLTARYMKFVVLSLLYTFGCAYMLYCWYCRRPERGIAVFTKGIMCSIGLVLLYALVDVWCLSGSETARDILVALNPYVHAIKENYGWWPPLLWPTPQLRSLFAEPAYFGMFTAFAAPWVWFFLLEAKGWKTVLWAVVWTFLAFCLLLTQARTGIALLAGELVLLLLYGAVVHRKALWKGLGIICLCMAAAFGGSIGFIGNVTGLAWQPASVTSAAESPKASGKAKAQSAGSKEQGVKKESKAKAGTGKSVKQGEKGKAAGTAKSAKKAAGKEGGKAAKKAAPDKKKKPVLPANAADTTALYMESNLLSLGDASARSNRSRYAIMQANVQMGLDHPILGVGMGLREANMPEYLPEDWKRIGELRRWVQEQEEKGLMNFGYPVLGEYTYKLAETGFVGLGLFLLPAAGVVVKLVRRLWMAKRRDAPLREIHLTACILMSLAGTMAVGLGDSLNIMYSYWIMLAVGYMWSMGKHDDA